MTAIFIIIITIAIPLLLALFLKKEYSIEREAVIDKPVKEVFEYIRFLKNQEQYSKWVMTDPFARRTLTGTDGTKGFIYAWDSDNKSAGKGEQEIKGIIDEKLISCEIRFEKPFKNIAYTYMSTGEVSQNKTKVKWGMNGKNAYPLNLMNLVIPKLLGKDLEISLSTLKNVLER